MPGLLSICAAAQPRVAGPDQAAGPIAIVYRALAGKNTSGSLVAKSDRLLSTKAMDANGVRAKFRSLAQAVVPVAQPA